MPLFSERNGYIKVSDILIKEDVPDLVANAICSAFEGALNIMDEEIEHEWNEEPSTKFESFVWTHFLNKRRSQYRISKYMGEIDDLESFLTSSASPWFKKLDFIEFVLINIKGQSQSAYDYFVNDLNWQFARLNFGYKIVADQVIDSISDEEVKSIEEAVNNKNSNVKEHFTRALELYSQRPEGDYTNSIKESISAVECDCRDLTGAKTLGEALNAFEKKGISIQPRLKEAFEQLYAYTNQPNTGIRHALMDNTGSYLPGPEEALFFLVSCSAFVNYLTSKFTV